MSEIATVVDPPMIDFGKHSGKSAAEVMVEDPGYVQWALAQPWLQEKSPKLVQFFITGGGAEASETPEHNALQAKFTQDAYCLAVVAMFSSGQKLRTMSDVKQKADDLADPALTSYVVARHPKVSDRSFERDAWDVQFSFSGAASGLTSSREPECSCTPMSLSAPESPRFTYPSAQQVDKNRAASRFYPSHSYETGTDAQLKRYRSETQHESACLRSLQQYFEAWCLGGNFFVSGSSADFRLELKPSMGDDFPAVLRQVLGYIKRSRRSGKTAVVVNQFQSSTVPWSVVKQQFWESGVLLIREPELDTLVDAHAEEWGASLKSEDRDFTVAFEDQM